MKHYIAKLLYFFGVKPKVTSFIDEESWSYGYGRLDGWTGTWEYQLKFEKK